MTGSRESLEKATGMKRDVLSTKAKTRIGFLNVKAMFEAGKLQK